MLTPITFQVSDEDGSRDVVVSAPDFVAYEAKFNQPVIKAMSDLSITAYLFLIWNAMHRQKLTDLSFDDWLAKAPTFDRGEAEEPAPLDRKQRPGTSQLSLSSSE